MTTKLYGTRKEIILQIEDRLGSFGTYEIAQKMYENANYYGWVSIPGDEDEDAKFVDYLFGVTDRQWETLLEESQDPAT